MHHKLLAVLVLGTSMICTKHRFSIVRIWILACFFSHKYICSIEFWKRRHVGPTCLKLPGENTGQCTKIYCVSTVLHACKGVTHLLLLPLGRFAERRACSKYVVYHQINALTKLWDDSDIDTLNYVEGL